MVKQFMLPNTHGFNVKKVRVSKTLINYANIGSGEPLVLIHGWTNNWMGWIPTARILAKDYRIYIIDMVGYGDSGDIDTYSLDIQAEYIANFIKTVKIDPCFVSGLSMGSLLVATLTKNHPEVVKKAILIGPMIQTFRNRLGVTFYKLLFQAIRNKNRASKVVKTIVSTRTWAYFVAKYLNMYRFNKDLIDKYGMIGKKKMTKKAFMDMGISLYGFSLVKTLNNTHRPILIIHGAYDKVNSKSDTKKSLGCANGDFSYTTIDNAGHIAPVEKPEETACEMRKFFKKKD